jgi:hypothetical protein
LVYQLKEAAAVALAVKAEALHPLQLERRKEPKVALL